MEPKFRYWDQFNGVMVYSDHFPELCLFFDEYYKAKAGENEPILMQETTIYDRTGKPIFGDDRLRFRALPNAVSDKGCIWDGTVIFKDGVWTVDTLTASLVANPYLWSQKHSYISSPWWSTIVGY